MQVSNLDHESIAYDSVYENYTLLLKKNCQIAFISYLWISWPLWAIVLSSRCVDKTLIVIVYVARIKQDNIFSV